MQLPPIYASPLTIEIVLNPGMTGTDVSNKVYKLAQGIFETFGEDDPTSGIVGNGHHIAQKMAELAETEWYVHGGKQFRPVVRPVPLARDQPFHLCQLPLEITINPGLTATDVEVAFNALCVKLYEAYGERDPESGFRGNGHHVSQGVAHSARLLWLERGGRPDPMPEASGRTDV